MNKSQIDTNQLKASIDCREIVTRYSELRKASANESCGPCPFCGGDDRFRVFADHWFCRPSPGHCGRKGDVISLIMQKHNLGFNDACKFLSIGALPSTSTPAQPTKPIHKANSFDEARELAKTVAAHKALLSGHGAAAEPSRTYLANRGLTLDTAAAFKLGVRSVDLPNSADYDTNKRSYTKQPAILLPWFDRNSALVAIKYRFLALHEYTDLQGKPRKENKTSRGNPAGRMFGWQAVRGPEQNRVLIITEGEINALSLWQAGSGLVDVLSPGTESMLITLPTELVDYAVQYQYRIVWADKGQVADNAALAIGAASMRSPGGLDANDLLVAGKLEPLLAAMLKKMGAEVRFVAPAPEIIRVGLTWSDAERIRSELSEVGIGYRIGADPTEPGKYRIVRR